MHLLQHLFICVFHSLTKDHRKRPKYHRLLVRHQIKAMSNNPLNVGYPTASLLNRPHVSVCLVQEHSFIRRYEVLQVDVAGWFQTVMDRTESPRSSQCYSHQHQLHSLFSR